MLLNDCEVSLTLTWSANCLITDKLYGETGPNNNLVGINIINTEF